LAYIRRGRVPFFFIQIDLRQVSLISLSLLSPSSSGLPLFGGYTWLGISPPYARRRAAGIGIRIHLLSAALLVRSPEGRRVYCMCIIPRGTTLVVLLHRRGRIARSSSATFRRGRNPVIGLQGPGGYRSHRGSARHRGLPVRLHQPRSCGNVSRLTDYILVCDLFLSVTCIAIA
jgi:hypothetical protein